MIRTAFHSGLNWFVPSDAEQDFTAGERMRMLVLGLVIGPLLAAALLICIWFVLPQDRFPLLILSAGISVFCLLPLLLKAGMRLENVTFLALTNAVFVSLYATACYGGSASPFLPWFLIALLGSCYCLLNRPLQMVGGLAASLAGAFAAYMFTQPFLHHIPAGTRSDLGMLSAFAATIAIAFMAWFWSQNIMAVADLRQEAVRQRSRIARMRRATEAAEKANDRKTEFLINTTYWLRTPLNAVIGYSEMMLEDSGEYDEQQRTDMGRINIASKHLLSLVSDVTDMSKIETSETKMAAEPFDLARFFNNLVTTAGHLVAVHGNAFAVNIAADIGVMISDEVRLRQIVLNLLSNAGKFTKNGRITLQADRENDSRIDWINIAVTDTGIGIDEVSLKELFSNFAQSEASASGNYGGTGLGLAICRDFCRAMGGTVIVESALGKGSKFTVRLPADASDDRVQKLIVLGRKSPQQETSITQH